MRVREPVRTARARAYGVRGFINAGSVIRIWACAIRFW